MELSPPGTLRLGIMSEILGGESGTCASVPADASPLWVGLDLGHHHPFVTVNHPKPSCLKEQKFLSILLVLVGQKFGCSLAPVQSLWRGCGCLGAVVSAGGLSGDSLHPSKLGSVVVLLAWLLLRARDPGEKGSSHEGLSDLARSHPSISAGPVGHVARSA